MTQNNFVRDLTWFKNVMGWCWNDSGMMELLLFSHMWVWPPTPLCRGGWVARLHAHSKVITSFISHSVILKSFCHSKVIPSFFWILTHPIIPLSFLSMWAWSLATHPPLQRGVGGQTHICINIIIFTYGSLATHPPLQRGVGSQTSRSF